MGGEKGERAFSSRIMQWIGTVSCQEERGRRTESQRYLNRSLTGVFSGGK